MVRDFRPNLRQVDSRDSSFSVRSSHLQLMFEVENGKILKRHVDHMRKRVVINEDRTSAQPDVTIQDNFHYPSPTHLLKPLLLSPMLVFRLNTILIEIDALHKDSCSNLSF